MPKSCNCINEEQLAFENCPGSSCQFSLSSTQQVVWLDQILHPDTSNYHLGSLILIEGELNETLLVRAFEALVHRHDALRLQLIYTQELPLQAMADSLPLRGTIYDFSHHTDAEARAAQHFQATFMHPFDLNGKLWRSELIRVSDKRWYWQFCCHHLIGDAMSLGRVPAELANIYRRLARGEELEAAPSYLDFITEDRAYLGSPRYAHDLQFWLDRYKILPPALLRHPNPDNKKEHGQTEPVLWQMNRDFFRRIENMVTAHGLSVLHFMYAVLACYFSRTTDTKNIVLGIPVHNRRNAKQKCTLGMFSSVIPVGITLAPHDTFLDVMRKAAAELRLCYKHQRLPITEINQHTQIQQKTGRTQLFDVMLSFESFETSDCIPDVTIQYVKIKRGTPLPLFIGLYQYRFTHNQDINLPVTVEFNFSPHYLKRTEVIALQSRLAVLMEAALSNPEVQIRNLPLLSPTEQHQLLVDFNATQTDYPKDILIHQLFETQAEHNPDAIAVVCGERSLSYGELNSRANGLAHHLIAQGVHPDDRVALCAERSVEMVVGLLAILKSGGAYVPLDPVYPAERLAYMLNDAAPVILLIQAAWVDTLAGSMPTSVPTIILDELDTTLAEKPNHNPEAQMLMLTAHHLAYVIYTSGATGHPKGVMSSHQALCNRLLWFVRDIVTPPLIAALKTSISFIDSITETLGVLSAGGKLVVFNDHHVKDMTRFSTGLCHANVNYLVIMPSILKRLIQGDGDQGDGLKSIRTLVCSGEKLTPELARQVMKNYPKIRLLNFYGSSEINGDATWYKYYSAADVSSASMIGQPLPNTQAYILDTHKQPVPLGVIGEVYIAGAGVACGYLNRPELTAECFLADPFSADPDARMYKTGDLGRWHPDGNIEYVGRNDFQIKLCGFPIELGEIETCLAQCHGVREAVVLAREDEPGQKRLVAYMLPQAGVTLVPTELRQQLAQHLAEYMLPSTFMVLETFPLTANGKLARQALPAPESSAMVARGYEAPIGEMETVLTQIWQELLGLARIGRHDHFFELGGHSLMIISLLERLRLLGWQLDVHDVFSFPILTEMAQAILTLPNDIDTFVVPPNSIPEGCTTLTQDMLPLTSLSQAEIDTLVKALPSGAANVQDIYPLAPLQEGILFHHLLEPTRDPYVISSLLNIESQTKLDTFITALQTVIDRHDILRTSIHWSGLSQPVQVVHRHAQLPVNLLTFDDDTNVIAHMRASMVLSHLHMDLSHAPLIRLHVATDPCSSELYILFQLHHIIGDNLSLRYLLAEMSAFLAESGTNLPPPVPYRNFVAYTRQTGKTQEAEAFFRTFLADVDEITAPFGLTDVQQCEEHITKTQKILDVELSEAIRETARCFGTSPAILFHAAWALVVAHTSNRDDVVFGTVLSGRMSGIEGSTRALGMFINTLPLRLKLREISTNELLNMTNDACTNLLCYEQTPLSLAQRCSGSVSMPLFSTLLNFYHSSDNARNSRDKHNNIANMELLGLTNLDSNQRTNYPLEISVDDNGEYFVLSTQTVSAIDPNRINAYITKALEQLISALVDAPDTPALDLDILPETERRQLLDDFNATQADFPQDALIHQLFESQVMHTPDAIALACGEQMLSYSELNRRANRLAHHLIALGVQPDDRVAICLERSTEMVVSLLGVLKAGGAYVPLDPTYPPERLSYMLNDAAPVVLLTQNSLVQNTLADKLVSTMPTLILDNPIPAIEKQSEDNPDAQTLGLDSRHLAYVIYTSGSTGQPKGVAIAHCNTVNFLTWARLNFSREELAHTLFATSLNFDLAVYECFAPLLSGGTVHIVPDALSLIDTEQSVSLINTVPSVIAHLNDAKAIPMTVQSVNLAGEALKPHIVEHLFAGSSVQNVCNLYGPSETTTYSTWIRMNRETGFANHIGHPIANTRIYILNPRSQPVPLGVTGEIYIAGAGVARGYLNRPELTAERFLSDPFTSDQNSRMYKTGDLGRWLADGNIEYLGRNDFQVKLRGFRIEPGEIEARLIQCHGVREAVVLVREDKSGHKRLVAYVLPQAGVELVPAELRRQLSQYLARYMLPNVFMILESFPLTPNGKLDRQALPSPSQSAVIARSYEAPVGKAETVLAQIWQDLLGVKRISRLDHFFELGGHSLLAMKLLNRMHEQNISVPLTALFAHPILCDLAMAVSELLTQATSPFDENPVPLSATGNRYPYA
ncbi:non-ribosomal peptide synthetase [Xenorhabdus hominickii]|uniref:Amino acid adenylation n=1 Tax=Xenorhabdus hominickii TaxID=351679 RepID=A0A2G0Q366_XENHO|nr:non-ribosomal peptide synthetase [Xenorhabdus hominickii]AOM39864.1 hypothetical protein A9255_04315 [Xenorhabdus hominickii]PHM53651.1 Amino acid adenylation [Xenorhabdus hominickii]